MRAPTLVPATKLMGMFSSSRTFSTPTCAMPRAKSAAESQSDAEGTWGRLLGARPDSPRPKACTDRMIFVQTLHGNPIPPGLPRSSNSICN